MTGPALALFSHATGAAVVAYVNGEPRTRAQCVADAHAIGERLGSTPRALINLCHDRYRFWCVLLAAALTGRKVLMPSAHSERMVLDMLAAEPGAAVLADQPVPFLGKELILLDDMPARAAGAMSANAVVEPAQQAIVAFTSGSTGTPTPNPKTWGSLIASAHAEAQALELPPRFNLLGTVPPQHMYGIESTVLLAVQNDGAFSNERPLLPQDVARALARLPEPRVLVTTPIHLRALLAADAALAPLALILSAAAPLPVAMARQAELRWSAPLKEIYGFTEAGQVATRRPVESDVWTTMPGVCVESTDERTVFHGGHIAGRQPTADLVELLSPTRFTLRGRSHDLLNVAGKRASLADLNQKLLSVPGVRDGVFHQPEPAAQGGETLAGAQRLMAFVIAPDLSGTQITAELRKLIDPVFLPRPIVHCDALPRNATGKLTLEALRALEGRTRAPRARRFTVPADHPCLPGHFPGRPIVPGVLVLANALESAPFALAELAGMPQVKFVSPLAPGEPCDVQWSDDASEFVCRVGERVVARARVAWRRACDGVERP